MRWQKAWRKSSRKYFEKFSKDNIKPQIQAYYMKLICIITTLILLTACTNTFREQGFIELYFCPGDDCEEAIIRYLEGAADAKCAFYDLDLQRLEQHLEGFEVLIYEENFESIGISVGSKGLMHNKFCVINKEIIITGSFNPTKNGNLKNNNNLIIIESKLLAQNYLDEFEELKKREIKKTKKTTLIFNGFLIENYFCPEDDCQEKVLETIMGAEKSIVFMIFSFTDTDIANALIEKNDFVKVEGVMEKKRINMNYNLFHRINNSGINVLPDNNSGTMHHKVFIIDNKTVITGSYNPTKNANEKNDENILIIHSEIVAEKYLEEFNKIVKY